MFKAGDKVKLAPHVTSRDLRRIHIDDKDHPGPEDTMDIIGVNAIERYNGVNCDVFAGDIASQDGFFFPSGWLVPSDQPAPLDSRALRRIIAELRAGLAGAGVDDDLRQACGHLDRIAHDLSQEVKP